MSASIIKKESQNRKSCNKTNKKSISEPNFTKSEGKVRFGHIFFENDPLDELKRMPFLQNVLPFQEVGQKRKMVVKIEFTPLSLSRPQNLSLKKGF